MYYFVQHKSKGIISAVETPDIKGLHRIHPPNLYRYLCYKGVCTLVVTEHEYRAGKIVRCIQKNNNVEWKDM